MSDKSIVKPEFPPNVSQWWSKKLSELSPEQAAIKKEYYKKYTAWKQQLKPKKERKLPEGVSEWWTKPNKELTPEQLEIRRNYFKQDHIAEQQKNIPKNIMKK